jgi:hypothetical protein
MKQATILDGTDDIHKLCADHQGTNGTKETKLSLLKH